MSSAKAYVMDMPSELRVGDADWQAAFAVAQPAQPVASSSRIIDQPVEEVTETATTKKAKSKARRASEVAAVGAETRMAIP
jgi:hypothetical protein